jgi:hypothetical protein
MQADQIAIGRPSRRLSWGDVVSSVLMMTQPASIC